MNDTYKMTIKKKMDKLDHMMKKDDYINIYRKDKRFKNFTEFYDYVKNKNYDEFMFGKRNQNLTDEELEEKRKKQRVEHILREEIIDREDFRFYVWIYKGIDSHLEFDDDYNCRHIQKRMYETSIILEFDEKLEKGYLNCTFDGLLATRSFREDKALRDYNKLIVLVKDGTLDEIMNAIYKCYDNAIEYYRNKLNTKRKKA